jgi:hypothetical protein
MQCSLSAAHHITIARLQRLLSAGVLITGLPIPAEACSDTARRPSCAGQSDAEGRDAGPPGDGRPAGPGPEPGLQGQWAGPGQVARFCLPPARLPGLQPRRVSF